MKVTITFTTNNAAFHEGMKANFNMEVKYVLDQASEIIANKLTAIKEGDTGSVPLRDTNGNAVGRLTLEG